MKWEEIEELFEKHLALSLSQFARLAHMHKVHARSKLFNLVFTGKLAMVIADEYLPNAKVPTKVFYFCLPKNVRRVEKWLSQYSNILVKKRILLPRNLLKE